MKDWMKELANDVDERILAQIGQFKRFKDDVARARREYALNGKETVIELSDYGLTVGMAEALLDETLDKPPFVVWKPTHL